MLLDRERGVAFVHVPKAAGTTVTKWLQKGLQKQNPKAAKPLLLSGWKDGVDQMHLSWRSIPNNSNNPNNPKWWAFAVVRRPYERIFSAFSEMKNNGSWRGEFPWKTVEDLVHFLDGNPKELFAERFVHLRPAHWFTHDEKDQPRLDYIAKMEELPAALLPVAQKLNLTLESLGHANRRSKDGNAAQVGNLSNAARQAIERLYAEDFRLFAYSKIPPNNAGVPPMRPENQPLHSEIQLRKARVHPSIRRSLIRRPPTKNSPTKIQPTKTPPPKVPPQKTPPPTTRPKEPSMQNQPSKKTPQAGAPLEHAKSLEARKKKRRTTSVRKR